MTKVSIIVPVYNTENYLRQCLNSIVNQTIEDIEIICVNDGSTDNSLTILKEYANNDSRIKIFCQENKGLGAARNTGMKYAMGEYLSFIDSDDWIESDTYEVLYNDAKNNNLDIVMFQLINFNNETNKYYEDSIYNIDCINDDLFEQGIFSYKDVDDVFFTITVSSCNKLYNKTFLDNINVKFQEGLVFEDHPFFFQTFLKAKKVKVVRKHFYNRRRREGSLVQNEGEKFSDIIISADFVLNAFKENDLYVKYESKLINRKIGMIKEFYDKTDKIYKDDFFNLIKVNFNDIKDLENFDTIFEALDHVHQSFYENVMNSNSFKEFDLNKKVSHLNKKSKSLNKKNQMLKRKVKKLEKQNKKYKNVLNQIHNSPSWKITKILRKFENFIRNFKINSYFFILLKDNIHFKNILRNIKAYKIMRKLKLVDEKLYNKQYSTGYLNPIIHYMYYGYKEGKNPSNLFNTDYYIKKYSDVNEFGINPLVHYSLFGRFEGRKTFPFKKIKNIPPKDNKRILYVLHGFGGGTSNTNEDLMRYIQKDLDCYLLSSTPRLKISLWHYKHNNLKLIDEWDLNSMWYVDVFSNKKLNKLYLKIIVDLGIDIVHIRHLIYHTFDLPKIAKQLNIPVVLSFHDFYFICPSYTLLDENSVYCGGKCTESKGNCQLFINMKNKNLKSFIKKWREEVFEMFSFVDSFITTSNFVKNLFTSIYPKMKDVDFEVIEHGRNFKEIESNLFTVPEPSKPIKILFAGLLNVHKGSNLIKEIKEIDKDSKLEFHFLGRIPKELEDCGIFHGKFEREEFHKKVMEISPSFIGVFSIWPETYCHTLTEAWSCGVPVLATKIGVIKERMVLNKGGWLIDYKSPKKAYGDILNAAKNIQNYKNIQKGISNIKFKSTKQMADEYVEIYNKLINN
ncbi:MAG: glycosyltransferase [Methanobacteriaceae archaeon]